MKKYLFGAMMALSTVSYAQNTIEAAAMQLMMQQADVNYIWRDNNNDITVGLWGDTETRIICDIAKDYPTLNILKVSNFKHKTATTCK